MRAFFSGSMMELRKTAKDIKGWRMPLVVLCQMCIFVMIFFILCGMMVYRAIFDRDAK